jgi:cytochrome c peroxidase
MDFTFLTKHCRLYRTIGLSLLLVGCDFQEDHSAQFDWQLRKDFPAPQIPTDNPMTREKVTLGHHLFYDKKLSANQTQACSSCHIQANAFAEPLPTSIGSTGQKHRRNAPALVNIAYNKNLTWAHDGLQIIERQLLLPMFGEDPIELGISGHEAEVLARFKTPDYLPLFDDAFPGEVLT